MLDKRCRLPVGTKDAVHVPIVVAKHAGTSLQYPSELKPGSYVKFTNDKFTEFVICEQKDAQGILNPFLEEISWFDSVIILVMPGITTPVRHQFDIDPRVQKLRQQELERQLESARASDPGCADCYEIKNNEIIRG